MYARSSSVATDDKPTDQVEGSWSPRRTSHGGSKQVSSDRSTSGSGSGSPDPEVLASEIEQTREELAVTLDAIADKVSPKRVASRTSDSAKEKASDAADTVKEKASEAAETVKEKAAEASEAVKEKAGALKHKVDEKRASSSAGGTAVGGDRLVVAPVGTTGSLADAADRSQVGLEPVGSEVPPVSTYPSSSSSPSAPVVAGAAAAVLVVLFFLRRRRR
jgi:MYXO-CTERM domain-containing protein